MSISGPHAKCQFSQNRIYRSGGFQQPAMVCPAIICFVSKVRQFSVNCIWGTMCNVFAKMSILSVACQNSALWEVFKDTDKSEFEPRMEFWFRMWPVRKKIKLISQSSGCITNSKSNGNYLEDKVSHIRSGQQIGSPIQTPSIVTHTSDNVLSFWIKTRNKLRKHSVQMGRRKVWSVWFACAIVKLRDINYNSCDLPLPPRGGANNNNNNNNNNNSNEECLKGIKGIA
jgi:hypothetical protein